MNVGWPAGVRWAGRFFSGPSTPMDAEPPRLEGGHLRTHPAMREIWPRLFELGLRAAVRPNSVGGQQLPRTVALFAAHYLVAANAAAMGYPGLTQGAAHLIEAFG